MSIMGTSLRMGRRLVLTIVFSIVFGIGLFRVIFQAIKRVIRFNLLFVLSGPAFLTSFHPATAPVFSGWIRLYVVTIFEQFIQFLTFGLGLQFLIATKQNRINRFHSGYCHAQFDRRDSNTAYPLWGGSRRSGWWSGFSGQYSGQGCCFVRIVFPHAYPLERESSCKH